MLSVSGKNWDEYLINKRLIDKIKVDFKFSEIVSKLIIQRKFTLNEIHSIRGNLKINNPFLKSSDFLDSIKILKKNIDNKSKILVIGDYDVDGCASTSLMVSFLKNNKANIRYYIPNRFKDGYGANLTLVKSLLNKDKVDLVIMLDCGSNSHEIIKYLNEKKISSIIIDHHNIYKPYPKSNGLINPKKICDYNKYNYLCTTFLVYFFLDVFIKKYKLRYNIEEKKIYVLLATVADVMPLRHLNRLLAKEVLEKFNPENNNFLKNFFNLYKLRRKISIYDYAFILSPVLNSAGRLGDANKVVEFLSTNNENLRKKILNELFFFNNKRKKLESMALSEIDIESKLHKNNEIIFLYKKNYSEGIIGILASRIKEILNKPCIVFTLIDDHYKGSGRSTSNFNIGQYIQKGIQKKIITKGGGHNLAAGLNVKRKNILKFKNFINQEYQINMNLKRNRSFYISKISSNAVNKDFYHEINKLSPFGNENSNPIFLIENVKIVKPSILQNKYVSCYILSNKSKLIKAVSFNSLKSNISKNLLYNKRNVDILTKIVENNWNNKKSLQLEIIDVILKTNNA